MRITVTCTNCQEQFDERDAPAENTESNELGQDVVTFVCPLCKKSTKSLRRGP